MNRACSALFLIVALGCRTAGDGDSATAAAALDSLHAQLEAATSARDAEAYAALHSDTVVFDWPALPPVNGRAALASLMRSNWRAREGLRLDALLLSRRVAGPAAAEVFSYRESWTDSAGRAVAEYGRYVLLLARDGDGAWRIDRFLGFGDSVVVGTRVP